MNVEIESSEVERYIETSFCQRFCNTVEQAIKLQFPDIKNLDVSMNNEGECLIIFDETIYTQSEVTEFVNSLKNKKIEHTTKE